MYNHQLDTFKIVADCKSFTAASKQLYVSPSAVLQQINNLEQDLNVKLFERTKRGLSLTVAGEYLYKELPMIVSYNRVLRNSLISLHSAPSTIKVGIPRMHRIRFFYELWANYSVSHPECSIEFYEVPNSNFEDISSVYRSLDIVEFPYFGFGWQKGFEFIPICSCPVCVGVPKNHPLSGKSLIRLEELAGEKLVVHKGSFLDVLGSRHDELINLGAVCRYTDMYSFETLSRCITKNELILLMGCSKSLHSELNVIPLEWDLSVPYGFLCSKILPRGEGSFYEYINNQLQSGKIIAEW